MSVHFLCIRPVLRSFPDGQEGGALMARAVVRDSLRVAGRGERARAVRAFVGAVLGPGHPCGDDAVLLVNELFGNSLRHSSSGRPGEMVTVTVTACPGIVRVEVADLSGPGVPELRAVGAEAEGGRGLGLVAALAARWGWRRRGGRTVTWFVLHHDGYPGPADWMP
jgi:anti-sigma regulatory factor (Ser/Thr protein kinase)